MNKKINKNLIAAIRSKVNLAFEELSSMGFIARTNFLCCRTCATAELSDLAIRANQDRVVYWHGQDEDSFKETGNLVIRYFYAPPDDTDDDTLEIEIQIGEQVATALRSAGLNVSWDGDPNKCIVVTGISGSLPTANAPKSN